MFKCLFSWLLAVAALSLPAAASDRGDSLRFVTFNVWGDYFGNPVGEREDGVARTVLRLSPDLLSLQEVTPNWWRSKLVTDLANDYAFIRGDEEAALLRAGEDVSMNRPSNWINHEPLVYRKDRLELLDAGVEFFHPRLQAEKSVTWGVFSDRRTGRRFIAFATHLWWMYNGIESDVLRQLNVRKILETVAAVRTKWGDLPVIGGGDMNCTEEGMLALVAFERAGYSDAGKCAARVSSVPSEHGNPVRGEDGRYHGEKGVPGRKGVCMLDRIFYTSGVVALRHDVDCAQETLDVSDHSPVVVDFLIK